MFKQYDESEIRMWIEQGSSIHLKAATVDHSNPVELTADQARSVSRDLLELSISLDYSDGAAQHWQRMPMQYLRFFAEQSPSSLNDEVFGGAYVSCYIKDQTKQNAIYIAHGHIHHYGWRALRLEKHCELKREDFSDDDNSKYYDQAFIDGEVFVFDTFPKENA
ncbi:hypothetical protein ACFLU6_11160 [Acidobacteriota bacterium]